MNHRTPRPLALIAAVAALLACLTGCYHETYAYRAVPNVTLSRPHSLGSLGPLVLVSLDESASSSTSAEPKRADGAKMVDALTPEQIARFDARMSDLLAKSRVAREQLRMAKEAEKNDQSPRVLDARNAVRETEQAVDDYANEFRASNRGHVAAVEAGTATAPPATGAVQTQTVLMGNVRRDWGDHGSSVGRTFVLFIDGPPQVGDYWMNSDNSLLITYSAWSEPARTHIGLNGSVKILAVHGDKIDAYVALRETTESDTTEWVGHYWDPNYWQWPWIINGRHTFQITSSSDPAFQKAAIRWINPEKT
jgi:hypothetical protein